MVAPFSFGSEEDCDQQQPSLPFSPARGKGGGRRGREGGFEREGKEGRRKGREGAGGFEVEG